ncbi:hypothetical protein C8R43DRAFT_1183142, partial [Mycena crocata]
MANAPTGDLYLYISPPCVGIQDGRVSIQIPAACDAYYWSLQKDGTERLSEAQLEDLAPPEVIFEVSVLGQSWSEQEYQMIQQFHAAKGFNPYSTDIATKFGYPL